MSRCSTFRLRATPMWFAVAYGVAACGLIIDASELTSETRVSPDAGSDVVGGTGGLGGVGGVGGVDAGAGSDAGAAGGEAGADADAGCAWYLDADSDGFGDPEQVDTSCEQPAGFVNNGADCDDGDGLVHPGSEELCDGIDNDCDSTTDDDCPVLCDGFVNEGRGYMVCGSPASHSTASTRCQEQGLRLVRIDDEEENAFVSESLSGLEYAWIGANDSAEEGSWVWADGEVFYEGGMPVDSAYLGWYPDVPDGASNENCAEIYADGGWNDYACDFEQSFVCERY